MQLALNGFNALDPMFNLTCVCASRVDGIITRYEDIDAPL